MSGYGADHSDRAAAPDAELLGAKFVVLARLNLSDQTHSAEERSQSAIDLFAEFDRCADDLQDEILALVAYEINVEGRGREATDRNPVVEQVVERILSGAAIPPERSLLVNVLQAGRYPMGVREIAAIGIKAAAVLVDAHGRREALFIDDAVALTGALQTSGADREYPLLRVEEQSAHALRALRTRINRAVLNDEQSRAATSLVGAIDSALSLYPVTEGSADISTFGNKEDQ